MIRQLAYRGVTVGSLLDSSGSIETVVGFDGWQSKTSGVLEYAQTAGGAPLAAIPSARRLGFTAYVELAEYRAVASAFTPGADSPLLVEWDEGEGAISEVIFCAPTGPPNSRDRVLENAGYRLFEVLLLAADPLIYSATVESVVLDLEGGGVWLWPLPMATVADWTASIPPDGEQQASLQVGGSTATWPEVTVSGPDDGQATISLVNVGTGAVLSFPAVQAGSTLEAIFAPSRRSVLLDGREVSGQTVGEFFPLTPGDNTLGATVSGTSTGVTVEIRWRTARL